MDPVDATIEEIDRLSRAVTSEVELRDRRLAAPMELTPCQANTLDALEELGQTAMNGLSDALRVHGTTMTRMVDTLVARGLIERVLDPRDRRVVLVRLSQGGQEAVRSLRRSRRDLIEASLRGVSEAELGSLLDGLRRLTQLTSGWRANTANSRGWRKLD